MAAKEELAARIVKVAMEHTEPEQLQRCILVILEDYRVEPAGASRQGDLRKQVRRFIGAKRIEGLSAKTLDNYQLYLLKFAGAVNKDAGRISADDIRAYIAGLAVKGSSLQTILATLRSFFGWLHREELIRKNPMNKIPSPKRTYTKQLPRALSLEALERMRSACETVRERALVEFLYSTGCRVSELCGIDLQQVDFTARCVRVLGKGSRERMVYFSVRAGLLLREYVQERRDGSALFVNERAPYGRMSPRSVEKLVHAVGQRANLQENVWPHRLRHTMATLAHNNGMQITVLQAILGHRQLSTTQRYATISMDNVRHEHERFVA